MQKCFIVKKKCSLTGLPHFSGISNVLLEMLEGPVLEEEVPPCLVGAKLKAQPVKLHDFN